MRSPANYELCPKCKMRDHAGKPCPFIKMISKDLSEIKDFLSKTPPAIFVGRFSYPNVNVGVLSPIKYEEDTSILDNHYEWFKNSLSVSEIAELRGELVNSRITSNVKKSERIIETFQEVAMARKSTDIEIHLKEKINYRPHAFKTAAPMGPNVELEKISLAENVKVNKKIEKAYYDTDLKAGKAITNLYANGIDELKLSRAISGGIFGIKTERKLVPTRWSITAVDDILGKNLISNIKQYKTIESCHVFFSAQLGNIYCIILLPGVWSYELFEFFEDNTSKHTTDFENYFGRKSYAKQTAGGYYASRLAVLDYLGKVKRQASVLVIRQITREYYIPLGVWQVRENVRKAFNNKKEFETPDLAIKYSELIFGVNLQNITKQSKTIGNRKQRKLTGYL